MAPSPEQIFLKDLEDFLSFELEFNNTMRKKVLSLLKEYQGSVNVETKVVTKHFVVYKNQVSASQIIPNSDKKLLDFTALQKEFDKFCKDRNIKYENTKKVGRQTKAITQLRTDFCNYAAENFLVSKSDLANFFNLNHATIHYYFNPKYKKKPQKNGA